MTYKNIKATPRTHEQLEAIVKKRTGEYALIKSKQDITAEAIEALYKKEIK